MACPICKKPLEKAIFYGTEVDYCPVCLGIWFDDDELRQAKDEKDKTLRWLDINLWDKKKDFKAAKGEEICPSCRMPLYKINYGDSDISVDICKSCYGIWLNRGEFKKIVEYLKKTANREILHDYVKNVSKEFWEIFTGPKVFKEEVLDFLMVLKMLNYKFCAQHPIIAKLINALPK